MSELRPRRKMYTDSEVSEESRVGIFFLHTWPSTAGLPIGETHTKNQFVSKPEGPQTLRGRHWKAFGRENRNLQGLFLCGQF